MDRTTTTTTTASGTAPRPDDGLVLESEVVVDRPAADVAAFVLDWRNDHLWRAAVREFVCEPPGRAIHGQRLLEVLVFAGRTYRTPTTITEAGPLHAAYAGGSGTVTVWGERAVEPTPDGRSVLRIATRMRFHRVMRLLAPLLAPSYRASDAADVERLVQLLEAPRTPRGAVAGESGPGAAR